MAFNISWREHVNKMTLCGDLHKLTTKLTVCQLNLVGHCLRHPELPASLGSCHLGADTQEDEPWTCYQDNDH